MDSNLDEGAREEANAERLPRAGETAGKAGEAGAGAGRLRNPTCRTNLDTGSHNGSFSFT